MARPRSRRHVDREAIAEHGWMLDRVQEPSLAKGGFGRRHLIEYDYDVVDPVVPEYAPEALDAARSRRKAPVARARVRICRRDVRGDDGEPALVEQRPHLRRVIEVAFRRPFVAVERRGFDAPAGADPPLSA